MKTTLRFVLDAALRLVLLMVVSWLFGWLILDVLSDAEDADIGGGILVMLIITGVGAAVAAIDGYRRGLPWALLLWSVVAVLSSISSAVWLNLVQPDTADRAGLVRDLFDPFWTLWIALPAYAGVLLGFWIRRTGTPH